MFADAGQGLVNDFLFALLVDRQHNLLFLVVGESVHQTFGVERCLGEEAVGGWDAEDAADGGGEAEEHDF